MSFVLESMHVPAMPQTRMSDHQEITDVATKLNLIPPVVEQCQHQYVHRIRDIPPTSNDISSTVT